MLEYIWKKNYLNKSTKIIISILDEVKKTCQLRRVSSMRNQRENQIAYLPQG